MIVAKLADARAQGVDALAALHAQVNQLYDDGKYFDAAPVAERYVALARRRHGEQHIEFARAIDRQATVYQALRRYAEAEPLFRRALTIREAVFGFEHTNVAASLNNLALLLLDQDRYKEAEPLLKRAFSITEKSVGPDHLDVGVALNSLGLLYFHQGRYAEAEPPFKRSLAVTEKAKGPDHPDVSGVLQNLAAVFQQQLRDGEAETLLTRAMAIDEKSPNRRAFALSIVRVADLLAGQRRYTEAEPLYKRALAIMEKADGADYNDVKDIMGHLAGLYESQGRFAEVDALYRGAITATEKTTGSNGLAVSDLYRDLSAIYRARRRFADAERLLKQALAITERAVGREHDEFAVCLTKLANLYSEQGRSTEAEPLLRRALAINEKAFGPQHPTVGTAAHELAGIYQAQRRFTEAASLYERSLAISEGMVGRDDPSLRFALINLANSYSAQGQYADAESLLLRAMSMFEQLGAVNHPEYGISLNNLARLYEDMGRYGDVEPVLRRSLLLVEKAYGPDSMHYGHTLVNYGRAHFLTEHWANAASSLARGMEIILRGAKGRADAVGGALTGKTTAYESRLSSAISRLIKAAYRIAAADPSKSPDLMRAMFKAAQSMQESEAAASLALMSARLAKGDSSLAQLIRERQDLVDEWQARDKRLVATLSEPDRHRQSVQERVHSQRMAAIDLRVSAIDQTLARQFPDYATFATPAPSSVEDVQSQLGSNEALVLILGMADAHPTPEETLIWVITKTAVRWVRTDLGAGALKSRVDSLRCGLDHTGNWAWVEQDKRWRAQSEACKALRPDGLAKEEMLPFPLASAHDLYQALFGQIEDLIEGKQLLMVTSGALTQLPFHVLVTAKSEAAISMTDYRKVAWLARRHSIAVLPAVSSLATLRRAAGRSQAARPYIGIGNPLLDGPDRSHAAAKHAAESRQTCGVKTSNEAAERRPTGAMKPLTRTIGPSLVTHVRRQVPLPETAEELCDVGQSVGAIEADIFLGKRATEARVKALSAADALRSYRVVHFATHGTLAGEIPGAAEPGLLLSPPEAASDLDDGYLSASEIAALKLDADWVILSACNTAAPGANGAEAFSGLARAFFYAGARALLVSHWYVNSIATVALIKSAFAELDPASNIGPAEALRRAMVALIDTGAAWQAHPAYWAPFVVAGEGATKR
jgi:CHAT domain-containing protein/tetratricopeptide (TPR) repeat protein